VYPGIGFVLHVSGHSKPATFGTESSSQDHADAGPMGHAERPHSESASNDLQFTRQTLVPAADRPRAWDRSRVGRYLLLVKPAISTARTVARRKSQCEPLAEAIMAKVEVGLSARRIYQDWWKAVSPIPINP
jgi:hypothetical protein